MLEKLISFFIEVLVLENMVSESPKSLLPMVRDLANCVLIL